MKRNKLQRMPTAQLDELLHAELRKDTPDEEVVLPILEILENREQKPRRKYTWIVSIAAVAAVLVLLITVVPRAAGADSLWEVMLHLSDNIMQFFAPGTDPKTAGSQYTFQTDNPGLQHLYNEVTAQGITDPVVPMWLPEGYELTELKVTAFDGNTKIFCSFNEGKQDIVLMYKISEDISSTQYEKQSGQIEIYESGGITHTIARNDCKWITVWMRNSVECEIAVDSSIEDLYQAIDSIYRRN